MPPTRSPSAVWRWGGFLALLAIALWFLIQYYPLVPVGTVVAAVLLYALERRRAAKLRARAAERKGESICTFVRAFAHGDRDPHVLRAVYEDLAPYVTVDDVGVPLRSSDSLEQDLGLDGEELEFLAEELARRCGRDLANSQANPHYGRVKTIHDLVAFLRAQPRSVAA